MSFPVPGKARQMNIRIFVTAISGACLLLTGCESTRSVPLEEAQEVTAEYAELSSDRPSRSMEDITALLDGPNPEGLARAAELREKLENQPPQDAKPGKLGKFHRKRAWAAFELGLLPQALADFELSVKYYRETGLGKDNQRRGYAKAQEGLGRTYAQLGRLNSAIEAMEAANRTTPGNGNRVAYLSKFSVNAGNLDAARQYRGKLAGMIASNPSPKERDIMALLDADAKIFAWEGNYEAAEENIRKLLELRKGGKPTKYFMTHIQLAEMLSRQGRKNEAEISAREGINGLVGSLGRNSGKVPRAVVTLARIIRSQGRYRDTEILMGRALEIFGEIGIPDSAISVARARMELATAIMAQGGRWREAVAHLDKAREGMGADNELYVNKFSQNPHIPLAMLKTGRNEEALREAERIHRDRDSRFGPGHHNTALAQAVLAMVQKAGGRKDEALENFRASVPLLFERRRQRAGGGKGGGGWRLKLIVESYLSLLSDVGGGDPDMAAEAFIAANWARGRSVQQAVAASAARITMDNAELAKLARLEQDTLRQIDIANEQLIDVLAVSDTERLYAIEVKLRRQLTELESAHAVLLGEIESRFPDYAQLIKPDAAGIEEARGALRPGEVLLTIYSGAGATYVWVVPAEGPFRFNRVPITRRDIARSVATLRRAVEPNARRLSDIPDFQTAVAHGLYRDLFGPVLDDLLDDTRQLVFVAHGPLSQLPIATLVTAPAEPGPKRKPLFSRYRDVPWLIRKTAIASVPSVSSLIALRRAPPGDGRRLQFAGFGDPFFTRIQYEPENADESEETQIASRGVVKLRSAPVTSRSAIATLASLPRLPDTRKEIRAIAAALNADPERDLFLGARASEESVYGAELSRYRVIAFATHGLVPGDLDGLLEPALALSSPSKPGGSNDGLLTMEEIMQLKLDADWIVLSACNTASADGAGAEAVSGLGRAFFYAGSRALLVSNWPVETTSARALTTDIFARQAADNSLSRAEALRQAMTGMIEELTYKDARGQILFSYAHPIFWAPFTIVGDGA